MTTPEQNAATPPQNADDRTMITRARAFLMRAREWAVTWLSREAPQDGPVHPPALPLFKSPVLLAMQARLGPYLASLSGFSLFVNLLYLSSSIYMMQIYNRVIPSGHVESLLLLSLILILALGALAGLDAVRGLILVRMGLRMDQLVAPALFKAVLSAHGRAGGEERAQLIRDFDGFKQFLGGGAVYAFLDLPWVPIYLIVLYMLHPMLAVGALVGVAILVGLTIASETKTKAPLAKANHASVQSNALADHAVRNRETVGGLHMRQSIAKTWEDGRQQVHFLQAWASDRAVILSTASRFFRLLMQSSMLAIGAALVIDAQLSGGAMVAASIILGRALSPIEQAVSSWRSFVSARGAISRVDNMLAAQPPASRATRLPDPQGHLSVERLVFAPDQERPPVLKGLTFGIEPGACLSVIGPSGAGKTTLARLLAGCLPPTGGTVRLDGAELHTWDEAQLRTAIGYLPQDVDLLPGTVRENIARFDDVDDSVVVAAAKAANAHDLILSLPKGYDTMLQDAGIHLSGGQRQRIGLARALMGDPVVVVLDEPNAHLDSDGELALVHTIAQLKQRGRAVVIVSHRPATLQVSDKILIVRDGRIEMFGPTAEVMAAFQRARAQGAKAVEGKQPAVQEHV